MFQEHRFPPQSQVSDRVISTYSVDWKLVNCELLLDLKMIYRVTLLTCTVYQMISLGFYLFLMSSLR